MREINDEAVVQTSGGNSPAKLRFSESDSVRICTYPQKRRSEASRRRYQQYFPDAPRCFHRRQNRDVGMESCGITWFYEVPAYRLQAADVRAGEQSLQLLW
jgi:hypothetical protein